MPRFVPARSRFGMILRRSVRPTIHVGEFACRIHTVGMLNVLLSVPVCRCAAPHSRATSRGV